MLVKKFKDTGLIYTDLNIGNIKEINNKYYLIDLEGITDFESYINWENNTSPFNSIKNKSYDSKIKNIVTYKK